MIYHLIDTKKYNVFEHSDSENVWIDFRKYAPNNTNAVVKDMINSDDFLRTVIKHHNPSKNRLFHVFRLYRGSESIFITDGALNMFPSLDERLYFAVQTAKWCLQNHQMTTSDIVWFLNHSGHFNLKNKTSNESELLVIGYKQMGLTQCNCGQLDSALSYEIRKIKNCDTIDKNAKIIVVNDINEGNSIIKAFLLNGWHGTGFLIGADVHVVMNSRSNLEMNKETLNLLENK